VTLKLENGSEVEVAFTNLSPGDLAYLEGLKNEQPLEKKNVELVGDGYWERPIPREAVLRAPVEVLEEKNGKLTHFSSSHFRVVADSRLSSKALQTMLEACELTYEFCEAAPLGLKSRFTPADGKYEILSTEKREDWVEAGGPWTVGALEDFQTGQLKICLENLGLNGAGRGDEDAMRTLAGVMIRFVVWASMPEVYDRNLKDWFREGLPSLVNCARYEKSRLDFTEILSEVKRSLTEKSAAGQKPLFGKEIEMPALPDLLNLSVIVVADQQARRELLGRSLIVMTYLAYLKDEGKATTLREGLRYASEFKERSSARISASSKEEFEEKRAALARERNRLDEKTTALIFGEQPWEEVQAEMVKLWKEQGLTLVFAEKK
jgi:hypothetical protein